MCSEKILLDVTCHEWNVTDMLMKNCPGNLYIMIKKCIVIINIYYLYHRHCKQPDSKLWKFTCKDVAALKGHRIFVKVKQSAPKVIMFTVSC